MMKITTLEKGDITTRMWGVNFVIYPHFPDESEAIILHRDAAQKLAADLADYLAAGEEPAEAG